MTRTENYTIKQLADLAQVSTRTLRFYDHQNLLKPAKLSENGYRLYDHGSLLQLQQILFFRELDVPVKTIRKILDQPDFKIIEALEKHRSALEARATRIKSLIHTIDRTLMSQEGDWKMEAKDFFEGFDESKYEKEAEERWGSSPQYHESQKRWRSYSKEQQEELKRLGGEITRRMLGSGENLSPSDPEIQLAVKEYFEYLNKHFYQLNYEFFKNLSNMWVEDERFAINYNRVREGGAEFVKQAVHHFCDNAE